MLMTRPGKASRSSPKSTRMNPASTTRLTWWPAAPPPAPVEGGAVGVAVIDQERGQPGQPGVRQCLGLRIVAADHGQPRRASSFRVLRVDERLQVGSAAGDQDADVHCVRNSTGASGVSAAATCPTEKTCSPAAFEQATASALTIGRDARPASEAHVEGAPHLVGDHTAALGRSLMTGGICPAAETKRSLSLASSGIMRVGLSTSPPPGDVGRPAQQPLRVQRPHRRARRCGWGATAPARAARPGPAPVPQVGARISSSNTRRTSE